VPSVVSSSGSERPFKEKSNAVLEIDSELHDLTQSYVLV
jgi:hypothetical protein